MITAFRCPSDTASATSAFTNYAPSAGNQYFDLNAPNACGQYPGNTHGQGSSQNTDSGDAAAISGTSMGFKSRHVGGAQFLLGDGTVRFISDNIDYETYQRLGGRADNRVVGEF